MKKYYDIKKIIKEKDLAPKVICLLLSAILCLYISKENISQISIKLPITFEGLEENYVVSGISTKIVTAKIRGDKDEIKGIGSRNIKLVVDLSTIEPGDYKTYPIECHKIDLIGNYQVTLEPENVEMLIEKKVTKKVPVIPGFAGTAKDGFMLGHTRVIPEYIKIDGPSSLINNIGVIRTEKITIDGRSETFVRDTGIIKENEDTVNYNISRVNVTVPIITFSETEIIEVPILIRNKKSGYNYKLSTDKVKVHTIKNSDENISENSLSVYIDCDEIKIYDEEFILERRKSAIGFVHVDGNTSENTNRIISSTPVSVEIVITKE